MPTLDNDTISFRFSPIDKDVSFDIDFQRTLCIPDTDQDYPLPPGFGRFPLRHVDDCPRLPKNVLARGGVILPIWQAEALWLNFSDNSVHGRPFPVAIKVAAGKVNAVTGEPWTPWLNRHPQDYLVWPEQPWLDGFCIEPGIVRQFVAMPLGAGYSVEEQVTGQSEWGGLQISVTPPRREIWEEMSREKLPIQLCEDVSIFPDMGLGAGGRMKQAIEVDPHEFDIWDTRETQRVFVSLWNASSWAELTGRPTPTQPPTAETYAKSGLPWFQYYGSDQGVHQGSETLSQVKSVGRIYKEETTQQLPGSKDVPVSSVLTLGPEGANKRPIRTSEDW